MPDDNDRAQLYDYHEHADHHNVGTHSHDDHPRHHHDSNGSVQYIDYGDIRAAVAALKSYKSTLIAASDPAVIGAGGFDVSHRTA